MTTVQRGSCSKNGISSFRRSLRFSCTLPCASTPWRWKMDLAVSMPIMLMLIDGGSLDAGPDDRALEDRKSTRLNSSHANISYAVFCWKKKHTNHIWLRQYTIEHID